MTLYFDDKTNRENLKAVNQGDYVAVAVSDETTRAQQWGTGRKMVRTVYVLEGSQVLGGEDNPNFAGGFGQGTDMTNYRGIAAPTAGYTGVPEGGIQQGTLDSGQTTTVGIYTGAAPCWNCDPQPDTVNGPTDKNMGTDYGAKRDNFNKGTIQ